MITYRVYMFDNNGMRHSAHYNAKSKTAVYEMAKADFPQMEIRKRCIYSMAEINYKVAMRNA